jgi:hypothetical protein
VGYRGPNLGITSEDRAPPFYGWTVAEDAPLLIRYRRRQRDGHEAQALALQVLDDLVKHGCLVSLHSTNPGFTN